MGLHPRIKRRRKNKRRKMKVIQKAVSPRKEGLAKAHYDVKVM